MLFLPGKQTNLPLDLTSSALLPVSFNLSEKNHLSLLSTLSLDLLIPNLLLLQNKPPLVLPSMLLFSALSLTKAETTLFKMINDLLVTKSSGCFSVPISGILSCTL